MNLLTQGIEEKKVFKTDQAKKFTIDGITQVYPVYRVRLDCLYYNDRNDRIATWISKYKAENGISELDKNDLDAYNDVIQEFIEESNPDAIARTQTNIDLVGQRQPGVVLADGRIIDGNRRFTCLRKLSKENTQKNNYFETVILQHEIEHNEKQIKMLELQLQLGEESRVDYNPIDRLVGVYQVIVESHLLTIKEYADSANKTVSEIEKDVELAKLLVEYLEFINAPMQFYIARDQNLNGPLVELQGILKNVKDDDDKDQLKATVFVNLLLQPDTDMTRYIRSVKTLVKEPDTKYLREYLSANSDVIESVIESLPEKIEDAPDAISKIREDEDSKAKLRRATEISVNKVKARQTKDLPLQNISKAIDLVQTIDTGVFAVLTDDQKKSIVEKINDLIDLSQQIVGKLDVS